MKKVVLDTNVLIAALATRGLCEAVMELCLTSHRIILCEGVLEEVRSTLRGKIKVQEPAVQDVIHFLSSHAAILEPDFVNPAVCRDPKDVMLLGLAQAAAADCIVTGDKDLLVLGSFEGIPIVSPRAFWDMHRVMGEQGI